MSPRYEDDPRPRGKKEIPIGLIAGCGLFAILIIGAVIWVLINLVSTVGDAAKPSENGAQTSVVAPDQEGSGAIPDDGIDSDRGEIPEGSLDDESNAASMTGSNSSIDAEQSNSASNDADEADNDNNVVYVTETVVAE